jgi:hypothetical protein
MKTFWLLTWLLATEAIGKSMLSSISLGVGSGIEEGGKPLDSKLNINGDILLRVADWAHAGLEIDVSTWEWSGSSRNAAIPNDTTKVTEGRAGFLGSFRGEMPKGAVKLFGQAGLGLFTNNLNISGGGVNGPPKNPPIDLGFGYDIQAGLGYEFVVLKISNKNLFLSDLDQNWFGVSVGLTWEYF